jgi:hypothetical protein
MSASRRFFGDEGAGVAVGPVQQDPMLSHGGRRTSSRRPTHAP